jgi:2',3'-cyclic-nucleotide 2'-phosphodiesterase (5'-nucleotidase family)
MWRHALRGLVLSSLLVLPTGAQTGFRPALAVVQINDVYRVDAVENGSAGGLGRVVTLAERVRRETGLPTRVLHAGDFIAPSLESRYFAGQQMIEALNFLHARTPLLVVPGNHEFDERRPAMLAGAIRESRFPWLAANVRLATGDAAVDRSLGSDTVLIAGGMRIGIFTLTFLDAAREYAALDSAYLAAAEREITALEARGVDAIVGLTHLELEHDQAIAALRRRHPTLLWIAGGHEHYLIQQPLTDSSALITKGDSNARRVWRVLIGRENGAPAVRAEPVRLDQTVARDPAYQRDIEQRWATRMRERVPLYDAVLGRSDTPLDATEETVRNAESVWGSWLADQMRGAFPDIRADVAVLNGGALRIDDVIRGDIRWEHLARTFGFPTRVALVWLRGRDLKETVLERGVSGGRGEGRFLQVSGARFAFDRTRADGQRVSDIRIQRGDAWVPLEEDRVYVVAVPDFLYGGGDGYAFRQRAIMTVPPGPELRLMAFEALINASSRGEAIAPRPEGRIRDLTPGATP